MKVVNKQEFLKLPKGTLYSKYNGCGLEGLYELDENYNNDYYFTDIISEIKCSDSNEYNDIIFDIEENGSSVKFELDLHCCSRDGCFDDSEKFAIYTKDEIKNLIKRLQELL